MKTKTNKQKQIFSNYYKNRFKENLRYFYETATPEDKKQGLAWYHVANLEAEKLSREYSITVREAAAVISVLSPRNKWKRNLQDAATVISAHKKGKGFADVKTSTFNEMKKQAFNILNGSQPLRPKQTNKKIYSFYQNICFFNSDFVTVDVWHLRALFNKTKLINNDKPTAAEYEELRKLTIETASEYGLKGYEFQAVVWCSIRNFDFKNES